MCGRFVSTTPAVTLARFFESDPPELELSPDHNVAPTRDVYVVSQGDSGRRMRVMHWGLVPAWAKDVSGASRLINARAETVAEKPSFRSAYRRRRCIIPVDGFYEWTTTPGESRKQPMFIHSSNGEPLAFAGLHEFWRPSGSAVRDPGLFSCCIITCAANEFITSIHDRMPVILARDDWETWLAPDAENADIDALLKPAGEGLLVMHPVSTAVNATRNNGAHLTDPVEPAIIGEIPGQGTLL